MTASVARERRSLDRRPGRHCITFAGVRDAEYIDRDGLPRDKRDKPIPLTKRQEFHIQDGLVFDESGVELFDSEVPKWLRDVLRDLKAKQPQPGITHPGRLLECTQSGCPFVTCSEFSFAEHLRAHAMPEAEREEALTRATGHRSRWSLSDFANPGDAMREGPSGTVPGPDEE